MSEAGSDSRMTTIIDAATGDQWRVPTRAFEAIIAAFTTARPGLDTAWAEAEAALPEGWAINMLWGTVTEDRWGASAGPWPSKPGDRQEWAGGPTPTAALRALATRLTEDRP